MEEKGPGYALGQAIVDVLPGYRQDFDVALCIYRIPDDCFEYLGYGCPPNRLTLIGPTLMHENSLRMLGAAAYAAKRGARLVPDEAGMCFSGYTEVTDAARRISHVCLASYGDISVAALGLDHAENRDLAHAALKFRCDLPNLLDTQDPETTPLGRMLDEALRTFSLIAKLHPGLQPHNLRLFPFISPAPMPAASRRAPQAADAS